MKPTWIHVCIALLIGIAIGYLVWHPKSIKDNTRGQWPNVQSPPQGYSPPPASQMTAEQRLYAIIALAEPANQWEAAAKAYWWLQFQPPRSEDTDEFAVKIYKAWQAATSTPPNWAMVIGELDPPGGG